MTTIVPLGTHVLVQPDVAPTTVGGIHLPQTDTPQKRTLRGTVLAIGAGVRKPRIITVGSVVHCLRFDATPIREDDREVYLVPSNALLAVVA